MNIATKAIASVAALSALALGGSAMANAASSSSTSTTSTAAASTASTAAAPAFDRDGGGPHGGGPGGGQHPGEVLVTGSEKSTLTAAAKDKLGSGTTIDRVETNSDGGGYYEAHATKQDGSQATVLFNKDGSVASVETGMGPGAAPAPAAATSAANA